MSDLLGLDNLVAEMTLGIGLALMVGNGWALWRNNRGAASPTGAPLRTGRVYFLLGVGILMAVAGLASLFN